MNELYYLCLLLQNLRFLEVKKKYESNDGPQSEIYTGLVQRICPEDLYPSSLYNSTELQPQSPSAFTKSSVSDLPNPEFHGGKNKYRNMITEFTYSMINIISEPTFYQINLNSGRVITGWR